MDSQYKTFQATLWEEFDQIEKAFVEERTELIESNVKEIENLFIMRRKNER